MYKWCFISIFIGIATSSCFCYLKLDTTVWLYVCIILQVIEPKPEIKRPTSDKKTKQFIFFLGSEN